MIKRTFAALGVVLFVAQPALAADAVQEGNIAPPIADSAEAQFTWNGGYAGIISGYGWGAVDASVLQLDADGARLGAFAGYNFEFSPNLFIGAEAELAYDWNEDTATVSGQAVTVSSGLNGAARARLGYGTDRALLYFSAGYAITELNGQSAALAKQNKTMNGWTVGAGTDYAVTDKLITRIEYRYTDFGDVTFPGDAEAVNFKQHAVNLGLAVKF
jgi:outer membrane immunogenic protein